MNKKKSRLPVYGRESGNRTRATSCEDFNIKPAELSNVPIALRDGRVIGDVTPKGVFRKRIEEKHFLKRPPAIALDIQTLRDAEAAGATSVEITDKDTGQVYRASVDRIWRDGKQFNRGWGWQIYLPLASWLRPGELRPEQPSLFGGAP